MNTNTNTTLASRLRDACTSVRTRPYPISDLIPLMQQAADALSTAAQPESAAVAGPVIAYRISDPNEPDLGSWLSESPGAIWCKSEPLQLAPTTQAPQPVEPVVSQGEPGWLSRLRAEHGELAARYTKLHDFRQSAAFRMLDGTDQGLMDRQENQMHALLQTLNQRINGASVRHLRSMSHD